MTFADDVRSRYGVIVARTAQNLQALKDLQARLHAGTPYPDAAERALALYRSTVEVQRDFYRLKADIAQSLLDGSGKPGEFDHIRIPDFMPDNLT